MSIENAKLCLFNARYTDSLVYKRHMVKIADNIIKRLSK